MKVGGCYAVYLLQWLYVCWLLMVLQDDRILFEGKSYGLWVLPDVTIRLQSKDTNTTTCSMNWTSLGWSTLDVETPTDTVSWLYSWRIQCIRIAFPFDHPDHTRVPMDGIDKQKRLFFNFREEQNQLESWSKLKYLVANYPLSMWAITPVINMG